MSAYDHQVRRASEAPFPYGYPGAVCYLELRDGLLTQIRDRAGIREAVRRAQREESEIFAAWPGEYRTDLFIIDDLDKLAEAVNAGL